MARQWNGGCIRHEGILLHPPHHRALGLGRGPRASERGERGWWESSSRIEVLTSEAKGRAGQPRSAGAALALVVWERLCRKET
jgi:hypothetical protein